MYKVGVIGAGKVGVSLGKYFFSNFDPVFSEDSCKEMSADTPQNMCTASTEDYVLQGFYSRSCESAVSAARLTNSESYLSLKTLVKQCDVLFITTPDDAIQSVWEEISKLFIENKVICHCSGSLSSEVFFDVERTGAKVCSIHPLMAINSRELSYRDLSEAFFTLEGNGEAVNFFAELLSLKGNRYKILESSDKTKYHAASVFMSNLIIGMYNVALKLLKDYGFSEEEAMEGFKTLALGNMAKLMEKGRFKSLTGPVERCDVGTVTKHLTALSDLQDRNAMEIYRLLSLEVVDVAKEKNRDRDYSKLERILRPSGTR